MHLMQPLADVPVGHYINLWKILPVLIVLWMWARLLTWMDKDAIEARLPRLGLNAVEAGVLILGFLSFLLLPTYVVSISVFIFAFIVDIAIYLILRQQKVGLGDLNTQFRDWLRGLTTRAPKEVKVLEGDVGLIGKSGSVVAAPDKESPEVVGYEAVQRLLSDPFRRHAEQIDLMPSDGAASVKFDADGVQFPGPSLSRDDAAAAVNYIKQIAGMDLADKRKPQNGKMKILFGGKKHDLQITTAGSVAGESLSIGVDVKKRHDRKLEELGMSDDQFTTLVDLVHDGEGGIVLLSAPKGQGLTSLIYAVLRKHDAFLTHIQTIERDPPLELEGITQAKLAANASGSEELKSADWVTSQEPDVVAVSSIEDPRTAATLIKFASNGRRVYVGLRAGSTFEALQQWRKLVGDDKSAMKELKLIISGRVVRKLCMACKVGYTADPEQLRRLNMSPEKVGKLFQARTQPLRDPKGNPLVCEFCQDMRYVGRVGIFEMFKVDDEVRQAIAAGGSINQLKAIFRKQRQKYLQESALARVEVGDTSVQEVLRVMGSGSSSSTGSSSKKPGGGPGGSPPSKGGPVPPAPRKPSSGSGRPSSGQPSPKQT